MLIGRIRPTETRTLDVSTRDDDVQAAMTAALPDGWEVQSVRDRTIVPTDGVREVEAEDLAALERQVPDGWQLLSVRRA